MGKELVWRFVGEDRVSPAALHASAAFDRVAAAGDRATKAADRHVAAMGALGAKLTKAVTLPLVGLAAVSVDQAAKFQKSMTLIQTAGGETAAKTAQISKGIKQVAVETGTSLSQLGEGIYTVAKAGGQKWSATEQLNVLKAAAQGAKAENVDLHTSVSALTSVMMSYHVPASRAVAVQNEIIRASGLAKTTMQEFAGSLATVVPIASAAHISFAQVGGAIATLTQHGTSAQEATQELANTIRNLQAPNNVAVKAMQQLGLNVVDVEKNLGKRGLTGTIDLITNAITKKMGPSGLIAVSAFKQSRSASADLQLELSKMPKSLADISRQFETGKLSYKSYYKDVKDLGGAQFELGKGFIATMGQAKGFNDLLKAGNPAAQTFAAYLKQVMGGATGLNTALQLGGENMAYFKSATSQVAEAARHTGTDVLGWSKTQDTLAVKLDKAKAAAQVMAVNIGTELLPVVTHLTEDVSGAVTWFEHLSSTDKKIIGWSAVVLAAIGPVLAIGARFGVLYRGLATVVGTVATRTGVASREISTAQATQARAVGTAVDAQIAALRELIAMQAAAAESAVTSARTTSAAQLSTIRAYQRRTLAAGEAATASEAGAVAPAGAVVAGGRRGSGVTGAGLLNGLTVAALEGYLGYNAGSKTFHGNKGLSIAGAIGGLPTVVGSKIAGLFGLGQGTDHSLAGASDYQTVTKNATKITDAFTQSLLASKGAYDANTTAVTRAVLARSGLIKDAAKVGLTEKDLTNAVQGSKTAFDRVVGAWKDAGLATPPLIHALGRLRNLYRDASPLAQEMANKTGNVFKAELTTARQTDVLSGKLGNLNTMHLTGAQAGDVFHQSLTAITAAAKANGTTLDGNTLFGQRNIKTIKDAAAASLAHAQAVYQQTGSLKKADEALSSDRNELIKTAEKAGFTAKQAKALADQIVAIPGKKSSTITVNTGQAMKALNSFSTYYSSLIQSMTNTPITPRVTNPLGSAGYGLLVTPGASSTNSQSTSRRGTQARGTLAAFGQKTIPPNTAFTVGEAGWEGGVSDSQGRVSIFSNAQSKAMGFKTPTAYASGTGVESAFARVLASLGVGAAGQAGALGNGQAESNFNTRALNSIGALGVFQWLGNRKAGLEALARRLGVGADTETAQLAFFKQELTGPFRSVLSGLQHATSARSAATLFNQRYEISGDNSGTRENNASRIYSDLVSGRIKSAIGGSVISAQSLAYTLSKIKGTDVLAIWKDISKTVNDTKTAFNSLFNDVAKVGAPAPLVSVLHGVENVLVSVQSKADAARSKLTAMTGYRSGVESTLRGAFDATKFGSVGDLVTGLGGAAGTNNTYARDLWKLRGETKHNATLWSFISGLAQSGQTATLQTLAGASPGQLAQVSKAVAGYNASVSAGGDAAVNNRYGMTVAAQQHLEGALVAQQKQWLYVVGRLAAALNHQKMTLNVDGHHISAVVANSHEMQAVFHELEHLIAKGVA